VKPVPDKSDAPGRLLGQLAHELSQLVRSDIELAATEQLPEARRALIELAVLAAGLVALVFALAAATWAAVRGLTLVIPGWSSPLVVAGAWLILAALLLAHDYPRRLLARLSAERHGRVIASSQVEREQAEQTIRSTAEQLAQALLREAETQGLHAASSLAKHGVNQAEAETRHLLTELADALLAPGKAGLNILDRLRNAKGETS
jgi:Putative Actinobacterial Holin-X, holin superfamily III